VVEYIVNMKTIDKNINIYRLYLTSLPEWLGEIDIVYGDFNCADNLLISLKNSPKQVYGNFNCSHNNLTSLEGSPEEVNGYFNCSNNQLTSLKGCPEKVKVLFECSSNFLTSLEGCPKKVDGDFWCHDNPVEFTQEDVRKVCDVSGGIYC